MLKNRMSKRSIGALIAGLVLGAQVGLATAAGSDFPLGAEQIRANSEPTVHDTYRAEHAGNQSTVSGDFPMGAGEIRERAEPPVRDTYQAEHAGSQTRARNDSFPGGPSEEPFQLLPGAAAYFDRKAERAATSAPANSRSGAE